MNNPFEKKGNDRKRSEVLSELVEKLQPGEVVSLNINDVPQSRGKTPIKTLISDTLRLYVPGQFKTATDLDQEDVLWIKRVSW